MGRPKGLGGDGAAARVAVESPPHICRTAHYRVAYHHLRSPGAPEKLKRRQKSTTGALPDALRSFKQSRRTLEALYHLI